MLEKIVVFMISFLIFSNLFGYISAAHILPINNTHLFYITMLFTIYKIAKKPTISFFSNKFTIWIFFYLFVILLWYLFPESQYTVPELRRKILSILSALIFMILLYYDENYKIAQKAILVATIVSILNNIYEFINPFAFFPPDSTVGVFGRSAGFYLNPTISGAAILAGMLLSFDLVKNLLKPFFIIFVFIGVFLTFSRSDIIAFILIFILMVYKKKIKLKASVFIPIILMLIFSLSFSSLQNFIEYKYPSAYKNIINRIEWFTSPESHKDLSANERKEVAEAGLNLFFTHPFSGAGLAATRPGHWMHRVSTHNIYLNNMAELGIIGFFLYPLLILSITYKAAGKFKPIVHIFAIFALFIGFFTHNILDDLCFLFSFALISNITYKSQRTVLQ